VAGWRSRESTPLVAAYDVREVPMKRRIIRDFRQPGSPAKFMAFCMKVLHGLTDLRDLPDPVQALVKQYTEKVNVLDTTYHQALDGSRSLIRDREKLSGEITVLLDQIASMLEAAFILNPDQLLTTGFNVTQERRSANRVRLPLVAPLDFNVVNASERGRAVATASSYPGAVVYEIYLNTKDPAVEADWFHHAIFHDAQNMVMENLATGNTFIRMRLQGQEEAGPWSGVVSTTIT
jgi:hypothetical protein